MFWQQKTNIKNSILFFLLAKMLSPPIFLFVGPTWGTLFCYWIKMFLTDEDNKKNAKIGWIQFSMNATGHHSLTCSLTHSLTQCNFAIHSVLWLMQAIHPVQHSFHHETKWELLLFQLSGCFVVLPLLWMHQRWVVENRKNNDDAIYVTTLLLCSRDRIKIELNQQKTSFQWKTLLLLQLSLSERTNFPFASMRWDASD